MWFTNQFTHKVITWPGTEQSGAWWKHSVTASYFLQSKVTYTFLMNPGKSRVWCQEFGGCILMRTRNENAFLGEKSTSAVSPSETLVNAWGTNSLQPTGDERSREILPHQFQPLKRTQRSPNPSPTPTTLEHLQGWWFHHILGSRVMMCITTFSKQIFFPPFPSDPFPVQLEAISSHLTAVTWAKSSTTLHYNLHRHLSTAQR